MTKGIRPFKFLDYLPQVYQSESGDFTERFLKAYEDLFEELETAIEGNTIQLVVVGRIDNHTIKVRHFDSGVNGFPRGADVFLLEKGLRTELAVKIPAGISSSTIIVNRVSFVNALETGDVLCMRSGYGIPDLFDPSTESDLFTSSPRKSTEFKYSPHRENDFLAYLAGWIDMTLRVDKKPDWNRHFLKKAIPLLKIRSTLEGIEKLLKAWLQDELPDDSGDMVIITDLTSSYNNVEKVLALAGGNARIGVGTILGEGPQYYFIVDLVIDLAKILRAALKSEELRTNDRVDAFQRAAVFMLDREKPAYTYYKLNVRARTMQIKPSNGPLQEDAVYAKIGETTLLWKEPRVYDSR